MPKCKITVLRKTEPEQDLVQEYLYASLREKGYGACPAFETWQEFVVDSTKVPEGFCNWAWADIQRDVVAVALGADFPWIKQRGTTITCCTDAFRPVIFKVERMEN